MSYRKDRPNIGIRDAGGGLILIRDFIVSEQVINQEWEYTELVVCRLLFGHKSVFLACMYRPPSSPSIYNNKIADVVEQISDIHADQHIICGDFNYPSINWSDLVGVDSDAVGLSVSDVKRFYDAVQNSFLHQHVDQVIRYRGTNEPSLLDLILTKNDLEIDFIDYQVSVGLSDHCVLVFDFTLEGDISPEEVDCTPKLNVFRGATEWLP